MDDNSQKEQKDKKENASRPSKKGDKKPKIVKLECTDEVASVEVMKEVENRLLLIHYNQLRDKLLEVVREKCTGCQTYQPIILDMNFVHWLVQKSKLTYVSKRSIVESIGMMSWNVGTRKYSRCLDT